MTVDYVQEKEGTIRERKNRREELLERLSYLALAHAIVGNDERSERIRSILEKYKIYRSSD